MNTPIGFPGLSSLAREVCTRLAIISSPCFCPMTRWSSVSASLSTDSISFFTMRPTGMPVQSCTTAPTACSSAVGSTSGVSPCIFPSFSCNSFSSESKEARSSALSAGCFSSLRAFSAFFSSSLEVPSTGLRPSRSLARRPSTLVTSSCSAFQRGSSSASFALAAASFWSTLLRRPATSMPIASSRPMISSSVLSVSMRRCASSISGGVACWLTATRAQAVSIRLTALSGSWRAGM